MKAIILESAGGVENLKLTDITEPKFRDTEVLVEVKAISVNPVDFKVRGHEEVLTMIYGERRPAILGWDIAGIVASKGSKVTEFEVGDRVFGMINFVGMGNAYAEYVAAPQEHLAKIPNGVSYENAAATTLAALTALQVLRSAGISKDDRVLIHAGSGGVGHFAIQIARAMGAYVITTSSAKNKELVLSLGADEHIDYREQAFQEVLSNIDFAFDRFNGEILHNSVKVVRKGGRVISIPTPEFSAETVELAKERDVNLSFHMVQSSGQDMNVLKGMLERGEIKPYVSKTFEFKDITRAHEQLESGRTVGKVVVMV